MFSVEQLQDSILAYFWNVRYWRDRQAKAFTEDSNLLTGLPASEAALLPAYRAVSGDNLALMVTPVPSDLAASMIKYTTPQGEMRQLDLKPRAEWTSEELEIHGELTHRLKLAAHRLADEHGALNLNPPNDVGDPQGFGDDGLTARIQLTAKGLSLAKQKIKGTKLDAPRGFEDALAPSEKQFAPDWLQKQWAEGNITGTNSRVNVQDGA